jgi:hypothetical protein
MGNAARGTPWLDYELDVIVEDYFSMLASEMLRQPYVKSKHSKVVMERTGRSHRSVEFKHQNISAVLSELGMPWIPGYRPKENYQNAIFDSIDRYLTTHPDALSPSPRIQALEAPEAIFVPPPAPMPNTERKPERLVRLVRKFDPVERDFRNRTLGNSGEAFVFELERRRLMALDRHDLAQKVRWIARDIGDGAGFDISSFNFAGDERLIEVKTTNGPDRTPFFLTRNEAEVAAEKPTNWMIYRLHTFAQHPRIFTLAPPLESSVTLAAELWRATF